MISFIFHRDPPTVLSIAVFPRIAKACSLLKKKYQVHAYEVGVAFLSEISIKRLNKQYRQKNNATDVLSFSSQEGEGIVSRIKSEPRDLGDLMICAPYAYREAKRRGIGRDEELVRLVVHGTLHLMGYDHADEKSEYQMFRIQETIVESVMK